ncbi:MAG: rubrerythrin family protein [Candidatus Margulisbacteria bacterium]|jgi:rubrerythrin|nr:rubrerythrin family protein [Candidatus Margulisiibacteriota bacterium]
MTSVKGTKTEKNLLKSFAGESQARSRYKFFSSAARKEGYEQIAAIFEETAENEKEHAERFFKYLEGGAVEITASYPAGVIGKTADNLLAAANGEQEEWEILYKNFAAEATTEGFADIAKTFAEIAEVEKRHETRYRRLLANVKGHKVFKKDQSALWKCRNCGYVFEGAEAPKQCPACAHAQSYFELLAENY